MSTFWDKLVKDEVWGSEAGKKGLTARLRQRWVNFKPQMDWLGEAKEAVTSLFCNDTHIFCGQDSGMVRVYLVSSGEWVTDLVPRESPSSEPNPDAMSTLVAGGKGMVAAVTWGQIVTVWSKKDGMDWAHPGGVASFSYQFKCDSCKERPCDCPKRSEGAAEGDGTIEDIKVTPHGKIVLLKKNEDGDADTASALLIMEKSDDGWTVDDSPMHWRCGFAMDKHLGCHGDYYLFWEANSSNFSFGSAEKNFEDWCGHPHNQEGMKFDPDEIPNRGFSGGFFLEPPFMVLVKGHPKSRSAALMVYQMETYKVLKAFDYSRGRCLNLITNQYVVVQLQFDNAGFHDDYVLIFDKKMLLDVNTTAEEVKIQKVEINQHSLNLMSINTTSLVFAKNTSWKPGPSGDWKNVGKDLSILNFWVERENMGRKEEEDESGQAEKKLKLT